MGSTSTNNSATLQQRNLTLGEHSSNTLNNTEQQAQRVFKPTALSATAGFTSATAIRIMGNGSGGFGVVRQ